MKKPDILKKLEIGSLTEALTWSKAEETEISGRLFENEVVCAAELDSIECSGCLLRGMRFVDCRADRAYFCDCRFEACDLSLLAMRGASLIRCSFSECKLEGAALSDAVLRDVSFDKCNLRYVNFSFSSLVQTEFYGSVLTEAFISGCKVKKILFSECDLSGVSFFSTPLAGVDLSGCHLEGITASGADLCGALITPQQAADVVGLFGIKLKNEEDN